MNIDDYQDFTVTTNLAPTIDHILAGLSAEAGEVAGCYQKYYRGDYTKTVRKERARKEIGGLMWYISELCNHEGFSLSNILDENVEILKSRQQRKVLMGDGDDR